MIHYTLLPEDKIQKLRWEYRLRVFIVLFFFASCAIVIGTLSLLPSYFLTGEQQTQALKNSEELQQSRQARGLDQVEKDLKKSQILINELKSNRSNVLFSEVAQDLLKYRSPKILISGLELSSFQSKATTTVTVVVQGKALTRESLINFKNSIEKDNHFSGIELPISDLAKSKDISFSLRLITIK